jgi:hypothetical protein
MTVIDASIRRANQNSIGAVGTAGGAVGAMGYGQLLQVSEQNLLSGKHTKNY